jgi:formamidopyrimidine-DNA glycosylase
MPELPEVETIARALRDGGRGGVTILSREIQGADLFWERSLETPTPDDFSRQLAGQRVREIGRRGKYLLIHLTHDSLLVHLRMSGDLRIETETAPLLPHDRMHVHFEDDLRLAFNDPRKFGRVWLVGDPLTVVGKLGPEPFDINFTSEMLYQKMQKTTRQMKPLLLDQTFLAGMGNIYTDEALHAARIHPLTPANQVGAETSARLWRAIRTVLEEGIRRNGASFDWVYRGGEFQNHFKVYQRAGLACPDCGTPIERIVVGQRGTHYCPECQKILTELK